MPEDLPEFVTGTLNTQEGGHRLLAAQPIGFVPELPLLIGQVLAQLAAAIVSVLCTIMHAAGRAACVGD